MTEWKCLKCGAPMQRERAIANRPLLQAVGFMKPLVEICGRCRAWHFMVGDGLRLLTDAECFEIRMQVAKAAELADEVPEGTLVIGACEEGSGK